MSIHRIAAFASTFVVVVAVIAGLVITGSPAEQRLIRFDGERVSDLREIARLTRRYWDKRQSLPADPVDLVDGVALRRLPLDPGSGLPYEYTADPAASTFELCAVFARPSADTPQDFWYHPAGRHCFQFEVTAE